jgi:hypothetical protein
MGFDELMAISSRLFFQPFRTLAEIFEAFQNQESGKTIRMVILLALMGNTASIISGMLYDSRQKVLGIFGFGYSLLFCLAAGIACNILCAGFSFFVLYLSKAEGKKPGLEGVISSYFVPDFIWILLLPIALIDHAFIHSGGFFSLVYFILLVFNLILKIKALSISTDTGGFKSFLLMIAPVLLFTLFVIALAGYGLILLSGMIS